MWKNKWDEAVFPFSFWVAAEAVSWVSLGCSKLHTLFGLLHFPSTAFTLCRNVSLNTLSHAHRLSSQDVILCREDVWNASHRHTAPSPILTLPHTVFYSVPSSSSGRVPSSIAQFCRAYFLCAYWSVWACQHTLWQCGVTRQHVSCSHRETLWTGWFTAQLFTPSCLFLWTPLLSFSMSVFLFISFLVLSLQLCSLPLIPFQASKPSTSPASREKWAIWGREGGRLSSAKALTE